MPRIRELGFYESVLPPGQRNAISDVGGVTVGHYTLISGEATADPGWQPGSGPFRTGVSLVLPHGGNLYEDRVAAAVHTINGFGKPAGFEQVRELGVIETPIALTGTMNVPRVADALVTIAAESSPHVGVGFPETGWAGYASVNPLVGETSDGYLSDLQARPIGLPEVRAAWAAASPDVVEGAAGAGTGTSCYGWKGGIGTASRLIEIDGRSFTVGVLVQANFGNAGDLVLPDGSRPVPAAASTVQPPERGSVIIILATDLPLESRQLARIARRCGAGLARLGAFWGNGSGDIAIAFSTAGRIAHFEEADLVPLTVLNENRIDLAFRAAAEATQEAVLNAMLAAPETTGRDGNRRPSLADWLKA